MKAAIYLRISSDPTGQGLGVDRQLEDCDALAKQLGWEVVEVYRDNDQSALKARPAFKRLLTDLDAGNIGAIIAWHADRLYRRIPDLGELIDACKRNGTQIATVKAGTIDLTTPTGRLVAGLLAQVATYEGEAKSDRWRRSIRQRREAGQAPGWGPRLFGYTREGQIIEAEAALIRFAATALVEGQTLRGVVKKVNETGALTTLGNPWSTQGLKQLLSNARLAGHSTLNGDTVGVGQWEPILSDELYQQVQAAFAVRRGQSAPRARVSLLLGLARCAVCETPLISARRSKTKGDVVGRRVYRCPTPPRADGCGCVSIGAETLEEYVEGYARAKINDPRVREELAALSAAAGDNTAEVIALEERLGELERQLDEPGTPVATIMRAIDRTSERIERLRATATPPPELPRGGEWPEDLARRARLVRQVVKQVRVGPAAVRGRNKFETERVEII